MGMKAVERAPLYDVLNYAMATKVEMDEANENRK